MATLEKSYNKQPLAEVLLFEQEWDAAIKVADEKSAYHTVVETVAEALVPHRPEWVIRASVRQAEDLIVQISGSQLAVSRRFICIRGEDVGERSGNGSEHCESRVKSWRHGPRPQRDGGSAYME